MKTLVEMYAIHLAIIKDFGNAERWIQFFVRSKHCNF